MKRASGTMCLPCFIMLYLVSCQGPDLPSRNAAGTSDQTQAVDHGPHTEKPNLSDIHCYLNISGISFMLEASALDPGTNWSGSPLAEILHQAGLRVRGSTCRPACPVTSCPYEALPGEDLLAALRKLDARPVIWEKSPHPSGIRWALRGDGNIVQMPD